MGIRPSNQNSTKEMSDSAICATCGKKQQTGSAGYVTRWLFPGDRCECGRQELVNAIEHAKESSRICLACGKLKGSAQTGSLTQWIFSAARCRCDFERIARSFESENSQAGKPASRVNKPAVKSTSPSPVNQGFDGKELDLDPSTFPRARYKPISLLGQGALGQVYHCWDATLKKYVAVKCLLSLTKERVLSFQNEARIAGRLKHECVSTVLDFGITNGGRPFLVMEYFEGPTLQQVISEHGRLSDWKCLALMISIAEGLQYLHNNGVLHRDLKPSNILVGKASANALQAGDEHNETFTPSILLIDFGLSQSTVDLQSKTLVRGKTVVGTPLYMSPDQIVGRKYDARSEIYSFGCIIFECITGTPPFSGGTSMEILNHHANSEVSLPVELNSEIDIDLFTIAQTCLEKDPASRFQSVETLLRELSVLQEKIDVSREKPAVPVDQMQTPPKERANLYIVPLAIVLGVTAMCCFLFLPGAQTGSEDTAPHLIEDSSPGSLLNDISLDAAKRAIERGETEVKLVGLTDEEVRTLGPAPKVETLNVSGCTMTDRGIGYLMLEKLTSLDARGSNISTFENLGKLKQLRGLVIRQTGVTDGALEQLRPLQSLDLLDASCTKLTDKAIPAIAHLHGLATLNLSDTKVSGQTLSNLSELRYLHDLSLHNTAIQTEDVRRLLSSCPWIKCIDITSCPNISAERIWQLEREFPRTSFRSTVVPKLPVVLDFRYGELLSEGERAFSEQQYATAISRYQQCINLLTDKSKNTSEVSTSKLLTCYENLGNAAVLAGKPVLAEKSFKEGALLARRASFSEKVPDFLGALTRSHIYSFETKAADLNTTESGLLDCARLSNRLFGHDTKETAETYSELAKIMSDTGHWDKALSYSSKAMAANDKSKYESRPQDTILNETIRNQHRAIQQHLRSK